MSPVDVWNKNTFCITQRWDQIWNVLIFSSVKCRLSAGVCPGPERHPPRIHLPTASLHPAEPHQGPGPGCSHTHTHSQNRWSDPGRLNICSKCKSIPPESCDAANSLKGISLNKQVNWDSPLSSRSDGSLMFNVFVQRVTLVPDPCTLLIDGVTFGLTSSDILFHMGAEEISWWGSSHRWRKPFSNFLSSQINNCSYAVLQRH